MTEILVDKQDFWRVTHYVDLISIDSNLSLKPSGLEITTQPGNSKKEKQFTLSLFMKPEFFESYQATLTELKTETSNYKFFTNAATKDGLHKLKIDRNSSKFESGSLEANFAHYKKSNIKTVHQFPDYSTKSEIRSHVDPIKKGFNGADFLDDDLQIKIDPNQEKYTMSAKDDLLEFKLELSGDALQRMSGIRKQAKVDSDCPGKIITRLPGEGDIFIGIGDEYVVFKSELFENSVKLRMAVPILES